MWFVFVYHIALVPQYCLPLFRINVVSRIYLSAAEQLSLSRAILLSLL